MDSRLLAVGFLIAGLLGFVAHAGWLIVAGLFGIAWAAQFVRYLLS